MPKFLESGILSLQRKETERPSVSEETADRSHQAYLHNPYKFISPAP
jgi:hypothetical protein